MKRMKAPSELRKGSRFVAVRDSGFGSRYKCQFFFLLIFHEEGIFI